MTECITKTDSNKVGFFLICNPSVFSVFATPPLVIPAQAGIYAFEFLMDSCFRRNDTLGIQKKVRGYPDVL